MCLSFSFHVQFFRPDDGCLLLFCVCLALLSKERKGGLGGLVRLRVFQQALGKGNVLYTPFARKQGQVQIVGTALFFTSFQHGVGVQPCALAQLGQRVLQIVHHLGTVQGVLRLVKDLCRHHTLRGFPFFHVGPKDRNKLDPVPCTWSGIQHPLFKRLDFLQRRLENIAQSKIKSKIKSKMGQVASTIVLEQSPNTQALDLWDVTVTYTYGGFFAAPSQTLGRNLTRAQVNALRVPLAKLHCKYENPPLPQLDTSILFPQT